MKETPEFNNNPENSKIFIAEIKEGQNMAKEGVKNNKEILAGYFFLLRGNIDLLNGSEKMIKDMIDFTKKSKEMNDFSEEHGEPRSFDEEAYTVEDVEREMQNIEEIKEEIKKIHEFIDESEFDLKAQQDNLAMLNQFQEEFRNIVTRIDPGQNN